MDKNKSLQYNYGFEAIPVLFHSQTTDFKSYIKKNGLEFLEFWWNHVCDQMDETKRASSEGISFEYEQHYKNIDLFYITLPAPQEDGDPIFLACIARPERRFSWVRLPSTDVYVLSRYDGCNAQHKTAFGEVSPRGLYRDIGIGLNPTMADFKRIVLKKNGIKTTENKV
jgi:hypothetical protein